MFGIPARLLLYYSPIVNDTGLRPTGVFSTGVIPFSLVIKPDFSKLSISLKLLRVHASLLLPLCTNTFNYCYYQTLIVSVNYFIAGEHFSYDYESSVVTLNL